MNDLIILKDEARWVISHGQRAAQSIDCWQSRPDVAPDTTSLLNQGFLLGQRVSKCEAWYFVYPKTDRRQYRNDNLKADYLGFSWFE